MLLSAEHISLNFGLKPLLDDVTLYLSQGDKVGLIGINGTGKSSFLRVLAGQQPPDQGSVTRDPNVQVCFLPQNPPMEAGATVLEQVFAGFSPDTRALLDYEAKAMLTRLGLTDFAQPVGTLSGGQRKRVALAAVLLHPADVLILDEPTNHLDIAAREWVEEAVEAFDGTLLFVSHDRYFINRFATRIWELSGGTVTDYPMGFTQYQSVKAQEKQEPPAPREKKADTRPAKGNRSQQAARRQLTICENTIAKLESEIADLDGQMQQVGRDPDKLAEVYAKKLETENTLQEQMARWEELSLQLEE